MISKDDWRLLNDVEHLYDCYINPTDGEELSKHLPNLKHCVFCYDLIQDNLNQYWYLPLDQSCCICEKCYNDFKEIFRWKLLDGWDIEWLDKK